MLEALPAIDVDETVYRYANQRGIIENLERRGLDPDAVADMLAFLESGAQTAGGEELLDGPFQRKPQLDERYGNSSRFSDGRWAVFYGAIEQETAEKEVLHHHVRPAVGDPSKRRTAYFSCFNCRFRGEVKDLRRRLDEWPSLVSDEKGDLDFCRNLGREASGKSLDGFLAPSARHPAGTTVPAFRRTALSEPEILGYAAFSVDPGTGEIRAAYE